MLTKTALPVQDHVMSCSVCTTLLHYTTLLCSAYSMFRGRTDVLGCTCPPISLSLSLSLSPSPPPCRNSMASGRFCCTRARRLVCASSLADRLRILVQAAKAPCVLRWSQLEDAAVRLNRVCCLGVSDSRLLVFSRQAGPDLVQETVPAQGPAEPICSHGSRYCSVLCK